MRIRPSALELAEQCSLAPWLAAHYPASRANTRFGSDVDRQVSLILDGVALPSTEERRVETDLILAWLELFYPRAEHRYWVHRPIELRDPETDELLTAGTPDLIVHNGWTSVLTVIDWKKRGQVWAGHLSAPDENLQQLSYLAAHWLAMDDAADVDSAYIVLACWDEAGVAPQTSEPITRQRLSEIVDRVRAVPQIDPDGPAPEAAVGEHCNHCYQRMHCQEFLLPAAALVRAGLVVPEFADKNAASLTPLTAVKALDWIEHAKKQLIMAGKIVDLVESNVDCFVGEHGALTVGDRIYGPVEVKGRRTGASVKALEAEGLEHLIKQGESKVEYKWSKTT